MQYIDDLRWRYATKKFDPSKKVKESDIAQLQEAIRLSATSFGLQTFKVLVIQDEEIRRRLQEVSWGQSQVVDCSHLFLFCNYIRVEEEHIDQYVRLVQEVRGLTAEKAKDYAAYIKSNVLAKTPEEQFAWSKNQLYILLGHLLSACATLRIDACPMEGFEAAAYNEILDLPSRNLNAGVMAAVGYRSMEDKHRNDLKVRKPIVELFETIE